MPLQDDDMIPPARAAELLGIPRTKIKSLDIPRHTSGPTIRYRFGDVADFAMAHADELVELRNIHNRNSAIRLQRSMERKHYAAAPRKIAEYQARRLPDPDELMDK